MKKTGSGVLMAIGVALALLAASPRVATSQGVCGSGFCSDERKECISLCGRCGIDEFACTIGSTCSSNCKCRQPCLG
jgi:hypothetical protein